MQKTAGAADTGINGRQNSRRAISSFFGEVQYKGLHTTHQIFYSKNRIGKMFLSNKNVYYNPMPQFLSIRYKDPMMLSNLLFWEDVTEYGAAEDRSADRLLRLHRAWDIFNTYLSVDSKHSIGEYIPNWIATE